MARKSATEFFKAMFHRSPRLDQEAENRCHTCNLALVDEAMGARLLERCPKCRGIWLSHAQLTEILDQVKHRAEADLATVESDGHADIGNTFAPSRLARGCPHCGVAMHNYKFEETGIWIDGCPAAHGIWLDQGELRLLAGRMGGTNAEDSPDQGTVLDAVSDLILGTL